MISIIPADAPIVLYVGRIASGKGIEHLLAAARALPEIHLVLVGPDDRHGAIDEVRAAQVDPRTAGRVHALGATDEPPLHLYREATVLCLPSAGESFGMAAAEAAAAGTPVVVTDRCGIASFFEESEALVVPYDEAAVTDALRRILSDANLRASLSAGSLVAARRTSWEHVTEAPGGDLPRGDRLAASVDERVHRRLVTPCRDELARTCTVAPAEIRIEEPAQRLRAAVTSPDGTSIPFSPSASRSPAAPTRSERTSGSPAAAASFTTTPHGSWSESSAKTSAAA